MSDDKNEQDARDTARLETPTVQPAPAETRPYPETNPAAPLPEAEPAWLSQWGKAPVRTTPRIRWAGIVWGLVFVGTGWFALWTLLAEDRRAAFSNWILTMGDGGWAIVGAFAIGGLLVVLGLIAGLRAATRQGA